jgi:hypothetical protein
MTPYIPKKYQTKGQKRKNRGNYVPYKYMTKGQKRHARKKRSRRRYRR